MKTQRISIIMFVIVCCLSWSVSVIAVQYDPIVEQVQQQLIERGYDPGPADGKMGKKTANAIKSFQKDNGLLVSGELNEATLKKLGVSKEEEQPAAVEPAPKEEQPAAVEPEQLAEEQPAADSDPGIERMQLELFALEYDPGPADGKMGEKTTEALKKYQEENDLEATGELDEATLKKLKIGAPKIECTKYRCTVQNGLTGEMVEQIKTHLKEEKNADQVILKNGTDSDLKKLPAFQEDLVELTVSQSKYITDITPLGRLTQLQKLILEYLENLSMISPIENLTGLTDLTLRRLGEPIELSPLTPLVNLERLILSELNKELEESFDISALAGKTKLKDVTFYAVKAQDVSPLKDSVELTRLYFDKVPVEDLSPLSVLSKLQYLTLLNIPAKDLSPLGDLAELTQLSIRAVDVTDLSFLTSLQKLEYLTLNKIPAKDMTPVGELLALKGISLFKTAFDDYSPLAKCTQLERLTARYKDEGFDKLEVISSMPKIKQLWLDDAVNIQQWDVLATASHLENFWAPRTSFSDLSLLKDMEKLGDIGIDECKVTNPEVLETLPALSRINIKKVEGIDDLSIFKNLWKLDKLTVRYAKEQFPQEQIDALDQLIEAAKKLKKVFEDRFNNNKNEWLESSDENSDLKVEKGKYLLEHKKEDVTKLSLNNPLLDYSQDFSIEVTMSKMYGPEASAYGLIWGANDSGDQYQLLVTGNGAYTYAKTTEGNQEALIDWTDSPVVKKGDALNSLSIRRLGDQLHLYVNYRHVDTVTFEEVFGPNAGFSVHGPTKIEIDQILVKGTKAD